MSSQIHPARWSHIELEENCNEDALEARMKDAGIPVRAVRAVTQLEEGIPVTQLLAQGEWNHVTGAEHCNGNCSRQPEKHVAYRDLKEKQTVRFHRDLASALDHYRAEQYMPCRDGLAEEFQNVAFQRCD